MDSGIPAEATLTTGATFQISNTKLYMHAVTLSINDNIKFLEHLKLGFTRTVSWNKYRSKITTQPKNDNSDCMIAPTFRNVNRLFVLSFKDDSSRRLFDAYYMPLVEIKGFNVLIDNKIFLINL